MTPTLTLWNNTTKGKWYVRVRYNDQRKPTETRHSLGVPSSLAAKNLNPALDEFRQNDLPAILQKRQPVEHSPGNLRAAAAWFTDIYLPHLDRAGKTIDAYTRTLYDFIAFASIHHVGRVEQIKTRLIQEWQAKRSSDRGTSGAKRDDLLLLRNFFTQAAQAGELPELQVQWDIPRKTRSRRFRALTADEYAAIVKALDNDPPGAHLPLRWMLLTPWLPSDTIDFRIGEDRGGHIDRDRIKTSRQMLFPVTPAMRAVITEATIGRADRKSTVFVNRRGEPWTYFELEKQVAYWQKKHRLDFTFRDLRVTFATRLAEAGCPAPHLAELMGHENVATTYQYYVRVDQASLAQWAVVPHAGKLYPVQQSGGKKR